VSRQNWYVGWKFAKIKRAFSSFPAKNVRKKIKMSTTSPTRGEACGEIYKLLTL
jgi:hypothetical protein